MGRKRPTTAPPAPPLALVPAATPEADENGQADVDATNARQDAEAGLSPREVIFCDALARGEPPCQAAKLASVTDRTGRRWRQRPEIQAAVRARLNDSLASARAILAQGSARAARSLVDLSDNATVGDAPKVSASRAVIESAAKLVELEEIEARLAELEARTPGQGKPGQFRRN